MTISFAPDYEVEKTSVDCDELFKLSNTSPVLIQNLPCQGDLKRIAPSVLREANAPGVMQQVPHFL
jgi:hypothetical protein